MPLDYTYKPADDTNAVTPDASGGDDDAQPPKETVEQFAQRLKAKYPVYGDKDDHDLVDRYLRKNPIYADRVDLPSDFKLLRTTTGYAKLDALYEKAGRAHNVDPNLLLEQGRTETINFDPDVMYGRKASPKAARGSGQFIDDTAKRYKVDVTDPASGIDGQARYMRDLLDQFNGNESVALAGYNWGENRQTLRDGKLENAPAETQKYVKLIGDKLQEIRSQPGTLRPNTAGTGTTFPNQQQPLSTPDAVPTDNASARTFHGANGEPLNEVPLDPKRTYQPGEFRMTDPQTGKFYIAKEGEKKTENGVETTPISYREETDEKPKDVSYKTSNGDVYVDAPADPSKALPTGQSRVVNQKTGKTAIKIETGRKENPDGSTVVSYKFQDEDGKPVVGGAARKTVKTPKVLTGQAAPDETVPYDESGEYQKYLDYTGLTDGDQAREQYKTALATAAPAGSITATPTIQNALGESGKETPLSQSETPLKTIDTRDTRTIDKALARPPIMYPANIKTRKQAEDYVRGILQAEYPEGDFAGLELRQWRPDTTGASVPYGILKTYGVNVEPIIQQKVAEQRTQQEATPDNAPFVGQATNAKGEQFRTPGIQNFGELVNQGVDDIATSVGEFLKRGDRAGAGPAAGGAALLSGIAGGLGGGIHDFVKGAVDYSPPGMADSIGRYLAGQVVGQENVDKSLSSQSPIDAGLDYAARFFHKIYETSNNPDDQAWAVGRFVGKTGTELAPYFVAIPLSGALVGGEGVLAGARTLMLANAGTGLLESKGRGEPLSQQFFSAGKEAAIGAAIAVTGGLSKFVGNQVFKGLANLGMETVGEGTPVTRTIEKLRKIANLSERAGTEGEKAAADAQFTKILADHGLTVDDYANAGQPGSRMTPALKQKVFAAAVAEHGTRIALMGSGGYALARYGEGNSQEDSARSGIIWAVQDLLLTALHGPGAKRSLDDFDGTTAKVKDENGNTTNVVLTLEHGEKGGDDHLAITHIGDIPNEAVDMVLLPKTQGAENQAASDGMDVTLKDGRRAKVVDDRGANGAIIETSDGRTMLMPERKFVDLNEYRAVHNTAVSSQETASTDQKTGESVQENPESSQKQFVTERPVTLEAQREAMLDDKLPKAIGVLYTDPTTAPELDPKLIKAVVPDGVLHLNRSKLIQKYNDTALSIARQIEAGSIPLEDLIGGKAVPASDTSTGTAVITTDADGNELNASKVAEAHEGDLTPKEKAAVTKQVKMDKERFGGNVEHGLADAGEIIDSRNEDRAVETQPLDEKAVNERESAQNQVKTGENKLDEPVRKTGVKGQIDAPLKAEPKQAEQTGEGGVRDFTAKGGNKIVDDKGEPLIVHHTTTEKFDTFKPSDFGEAGQHSYFYFAADPKWATRFAKDEFTQSGRAGTPRTGQYNLDIKNPLDLRENSVQRLSEWKDYLSGKGFDFSKGLSADWERRTGESKHQPKIGAWQLFRHDLGAFRQAAIDAGYDGIVMPDVVRGKADNTTYVAFHPEQIQAKVPAENFSTWPLEYHGTSPEHVKSILKEGFKSHDEKTGISTTQDYSEALDYANGNPKNIIAVRVRPDAEMVGTPGKDFITGTGSFSPNDLKAEGIAQPPSPQQEAKPKTITPVALAKPQLVEFGTRGTYRKLKNSHNVSRLKKAGWQFKNLNKKAATITHAPEGTSPANIAGGEFENAVYNTDAERSAGRKPSNRVGKSFFQPKAGKALTLTEFVRSAGGIKPDNVKDTRKGRRGVNSGELDRLKHVRGLVNEKSPHTAEAMAQSAHEAGYFPGHSEQHGGLQISADEFLQALESDASGFHSHISAAGEGEGSYDDQLEREIRDRSRTAMTADLLQDMTPDEVAQVSKIAEWIADDEVWPVFEDVELGGEISQENRDKALKRALQYGVEKPHAEWFIKNLETLATRERPSQEIAGETSAPDADGNAAGDTSGQDSIYTTEFHPGDAYEPDGEIDDSFDFADEERAAIATDAAHDAATSPHNDLPEPSQAMYEAGNYKLGHFDINGLHISVENPVGSERKGIDRDGTPWSNTMTSHYGYIRNGRAESGYIKTHGADGEHVDVFVKDGTPADFDGDVYVIDQIHPDNGTFDEHKIILGADSEKEARAIYRSNYAKDWKGLKAITPMPFDAFKDWVLNHKATQNPAEHFENPAVEKPVETQGTLIDQRGLDEEGLFAQGGPKTVGEGTDKSGDDKKKTIADLQAKREASEQKQNIDVFGESNAATLTNISERGKLLGEPYDAATAVLARRNDVKKAGKKLGDLIPDTTAAIDQAAAAKAEGTDYYTFADNPNLFGENMTPEQRGIYNSIADGSFVRNFNDKVDAAIGTPRNGLKSVVQKPDEDMVEYVPPYTLSVLEGDRLGNMAGKIVKRETVAQALGGKGVKGIEKTIINEVLEYPEFRGKQMFPFDDFKRAVQMELMPLKMIVSGSYADYGIENTGIRDEAGISYDKRVAETGGPSGDKSVAAETHIWNTDLEHGHTGHFASAFQSSFATNEAMRAAAAIDYKIESREQNGTTHYFIVPEGLTLTRENIESSVQHVTTDRANAERYLDWLKNRAVDAPNMGMFGHTRVWTFGKTAAIAEVQSDVFQKYKAEDMMIESYQKKRYMGLPRDLAIGKLYQLLTKHNDALGKIDQMDRNTFTAEERLEKYDKEIKNAHSVLSELAIAKPLIDRYQQELTKATEAGEDRLEAVSRLRGDAYRDADIKGLPALSDSASRAMALERPTYAGAVSQSLNGWYAIDPRIQKWKDFIRDTENKVVALKAVMATPAYKEFAQNKAEYQAARAAFLEALPLRDKQFIAHKKNNQLRLLREEIRRQAMNGMEKVRIPTPRTLALIEGYFSNMGEGNGEQIPYTLSDGSVPEDDLEAGDYIKYLDKEWEVYEVDHRSVKIVPRGEIYTYDGYEEQKGQAEYLKERAQEELAQYENKKVTEDDITEALNAAGIYSYKFDAEKHFELDDNDKFKFKFAEIDSDLDDLWEDAADLEQDRSSDWEWFYQTDNDRYKYIEKGTDVETLEQPDQYSKPTEVKDFDIDDYSDTQQTVLKGYEDLNKSFLEECAPESAGHFKGRTGVVTPDGDIKSYVVNDADGNEWLEATIPEDQREKPVKLFSRAGKPDDVEAGFKKWRRSNITYRGVADEAVDGENGRSGMLGRGLYTAPSSNKAMTREYGKTRLVANARPKNPKVFDDLNRWQIWEQNNLYPKDANGFPDARLFGKEGKTIEGEMQKMGYDGIEIKGREMVHFAPPDNVVYFSNEQQARQYYEAVVHGNDETLFSKRSADSAHLLTEVLPTAHTQTVLEGIDSAVKKGNLWINEYASEELRRLLGEDYLRENGKETDELPFDGVIWNADYIHSLVALGRELTAEYEKAGYTPEQLAKRNALLNNLESLANANKDFGIAYTYDDVLPEEEMHLEDMRAGRTDSEAMAELKTSPLWTNPGKAFLADYPNLNDADKASEIAAKLATDQSAKYGWDKIEDFDAVKEHFLNHWADGIVRKNADFINEHGIEAFINKFGRISAYASATRDQTAKNATGATSGNDGAESGDKKTSSGQSSGAESEATDTAEGSEDARDRADQPADDVQGPDGRGRVTSSKNAVVDREREARGLPPIMKQAAKDFGTVWDKAMAELDRNSEAGRDLVDELARHSNKIPTDEENALLVHRKIVLQNQYDPLADAVIDAMMSGNENTLAVAKLQLAPIADALDKLDAVTVAAGTAAGRALNSRRMMVNEDFTLAALERRTRVSVGGRPLDDAEFQSLKKIADEYKAKVADLEAHLSERDTTIADMIAERPNERVTAAAETLVKRLQEKAKAAREELKTGEFAPQKADALKSVAKKPDQTETEAFKKWFGDSKVVDSDGQPLVVYRGDVLGQKREVFHPDVFFSTEKDHAEGFGETNEYYLRVERPFDTGDAAHIQRLLDAVGELHDTYDDQTYTTAQGFLDATSSDTWEAIEPYKETIRGMDYDGIRLYEGGIENYLVFGPTQIKSAIGNQGTFDLHDRSILKSVAGEPSKLDKKTLNLLADVGAEHIASAGLDYSRWKDAMLTEFGDKIEPHLDTVWDASNKAFDGVGSYVKNAVIGKADTVESLSAKLKKKIDGGDDDISNLVGRLAKMLIKQGVKDRDALIDSIHGVLETIDPEITRRDTMDALSGYGKYKTLSKDEAAAALRDIKGQLQQISKLEDMAAGQAPSKTGMERRTPSDEERRLIQAVEDAKRRGGYDVTDPETQLKTSQASIKTRLEHQIADIQNEIDTKTQVIKTKHETATTPEIDVLRKELADVRALHEEIFGKRSRPGMTDAQKLKSWKTRATNRLHELTQKVSAGDFTKSVKKPSTALDAEALKLKADIEKVVQQFNRGIRENELKNRKWWEKGLDVSQKYRRAALLSGPGVLEKLTAAAVARVVSTPAEQLFEHGWGMAFPGIAEKMSREYGFRTMAEGKAITELVTSGMADAWDNLRMRDTSLDLVYGKPHYDPKTKLEYFGYIHGALKAPIKRAAFARYFQLGMMKVIKNNPELAHDDVVQMQVGLEAYKAANRAIFMQDNFVTDAWRSTISSLKRLDPKTGHPRPAPLVVATIMQDLLPIVKIPTNFVGETIKYSPAGIPVGLIKAGIAYHKGTENLHPEDADSILRWLKKGGLGAVAALLGILFYKSIGGYYEGQRDEKDVKAGGLRTPFFDIASTFLHNPFAEIMQLTATFRRVIESKLNKKDENTQGVAMALIASSLGLISEVPFVKETADIGKLLDPQKRAQFIDEQVKSWFVPQLLSQGAEYIDKPGGLRDWHTWVPQLVDPIKRKPNGLFETLETGLPGLRTYVPAATDLKAGNDNRLDPSKVSPAALAAQESRSRLTKELDLFQTAKTAGKDTPEMQALLKEKLDKAQKQGTLTDAQAAAANQLLGTDAYAGKPETEEVQFPKMARYSKNADGFIEKMAAWAEGAWHDPVDAFNKFWSNESILRLENGEIIVKRMDKDGPEGSEAVRKNRGGGGKAVKLDHTIPLEIGGTNDPANLRLVTTAEWAKYTPMENYVAGALHDGTINARDAQKLILDFKNGKITEQDITKQVGIPYKREDYTTTSDEDNPAKLGDDKPQRSVAEKLNSDSVENSLKLWNSKQSEMSAQDKLEFRNRFRLKIIKSNDERKLSDADYAAAKDILGTLPPHMPVLKKPAKPLRGMTELQKLH